MVQEHFLGQRRALAQRKQLKHLIFLAGQVNALAAHFNRLGIEIDDQLAGGDDRLRMALGTADDCVNAGNKLVLVERLRHVIVCAKAEAANLVLDAGHAGQDEDRRLDLGKPKRSQHLVTRHVGEVKVEKNNVVVVKLAKVHAFLTEVGRVNVKAFRLQHQFNALRCRAVVFNQ